MSIVSINDLQVNTKQIFKSLKSGQKSLEIVRENQLEGALLSPKEYKRYCQLIKWEQIDKEVAEAKKN